MNIHPLSSAPDGVRGAALADSPTASGARRTRLGAYLLSLVFCLFPLVLLRIPPIIDLPQQLHQIVLAERVLQGLEPELEIQWAGPNKLGYVPLAAAWLVGGAEEGFRLATILQGFIWVSVIHLLSWRLRLGIANTIFASAFLFSTVFYVGVFNFVMGIVGLGYWLVELERDARSTPAWRLAAHSAVASALLYFSHALWFAVGSILVVSVILLRRFTWKETVARGLGILPVFLLALIWAGNFGGTSWQANVRMSSMPWQRVRSLELFSDLLLGALPGRFEQFFVALWLAFVLAGIAYAFTRAGKGSVRPTVLAAGLLFLGLAIVLPVKLDRTLLFAERWGPMAAALLLLALPEPPARKWLIRGLAVTVLAALSATTAAAWIRFDRDELAGFREAIDAVPQGAAVLSLDFIRKSRYLDLDPFFHLGVVAGVERGATTGFSFTQFPSSLVVRKDRAWWSPWHASLEWNPGWATPSDFRHFDVLLLHAEPDVVHRALSNTIGLRPIRLSPKWSLLAVDRESVARRPPPPAVSQLPSTPP